MIISKTPFRISIGGGGTDHPSYYNNYGGKVIGFTIDKYSYIYFREGNNISDKNFFLQYSQIEKTNKIENIKHPLIKNTLKYFKFNKPCSIFSDADLPSKTGLGSSSSFTVGLCNIMNKIKNKRFNSKKLYQDAIQIEQNLMKQSIGSQDQIFAATGGFNIINFSKDKISIKKVLLNDNKTNQINKNFLLVYTKIKRYSEKIEHDKLQNINSKKKIFDNLKNQVNFLTQEFLPENKTLDLNNIGNILKEGWYLKKSLSKYVANSNLDKIYDYALASGALGGKILGAGGGGFFLFIVEDNKLKFFKKKFDKFNIIDFKLSNLGASFIK